MADEAQSFADNTNQVLKQRTTNVGVTNGMVSHSAKFQMGTVDTTIGALGGLNSGAVLISSCGAIVGSATTSSGSRRACLSENGDDYNLNDLVDLPDVTLTNVGRSMDGDRSSRRATRQPFASAKFMTRA